MKNEVFATSLFKFKKLALDENLIWSLQLSLRSILPQSYREYTFKFSLNEEPFNVRIKDLELRKAEIKADKQGDLFPSEGARKTQLKNIDNEIDEIKDELKEALESTPVFEFFGVISKLEYKGGNTIVTFMIPSDHVEDLDKNKEIFDNYKVELLREA